MILNYNHIRWKLVEYSSTSYVCVECFFFIYNKLYCECMDIFSNQIYFVMQAKGNILLTVYEINWFQWVLITTQEHLMEALNHTLTQRELYTVVVSVMLLVWEHWITHMHRIRKIRIIAATQQTSVTTPWMLSDTILNSIKDRIYSHKILPPTMLFSLTHCRIHMSAQHRKSCHCMEGGAEV